MTAAPYAGRRASLVEAAAGRGARRVVVTGAADIYYLTGYRTNLYSRPISLLLAPDRAVLVVPGLEAAQAEATATVDEVRVYYEHPTPGSHDHDELLRDALAGDGDGSGPVGVDERTCTLATTRVAGAELVDVGGDLRRLRLVKDAGELSRVRDAAALVSLAVRSTLAGEIAGVTEIELDGRGDRALRQAAAERYPNAALESFAMSPSGAVRTLLPHTYSTTRQLEVGDVVIHTRQVAVDGYRSEYERTVVVGEPTAEQAAALDVVGRAQAAAVAAVKPGAAAADVDLAARTVLDDAGFGAYAIHRTGHGVGLSFHEGPSLDFANGTALAEGMVVTVEPGFYVPGLGGFRHSDTAIVTAAGCEVVTGEHRSEG